MKFEEVIRILKMAELEWSPLEYRDAFDIATEVIDKQIPKEPIWEGDGYADGEMVYDTWRCPECDLPYEQDQIHNYCPNCGQKILWWEESE